MRPPLLILLLAVACGTMTAIDENGELAAAELEETGCDLADENEAVDGRGDTCQEAIDLGEVADNGAAVELTGNLHSADDADWFVVHAVDLGGDEARGWEDFRLEVDLVSGAGIFQFRVLRGGCAGGETCPEIGYEAYSWFIEDVEPDPLGDLAANPQACGAPPLDPCEDWTGDYLIEVIRLDEDYDCTPYVLEIANGVW